MEQIVVVAVILSIAPNHDDNTGGELLLPDP